MKFLCVECDQPMALRETLGPDNGSLSVIFECGSCGKETAMLTNHMETQMIHSLGVKVGGRTEPAAPMETIRDNLDGFEAVEDAEPAAEPAPHSPEWYAQKMGGGAQAAKGGGAPAAKTAGDGPGCPFSGMVAPQIEAASELTWTPEAQARMERIPSFIRPMVQKGIEDVVRAEGTTHIDEGVLERVRGQMGM
jgi:hypothetical protein